MYASVATDASQVTSSARTCTRPPEASATRSSSSARSGARHVASTRPPPPASARTIPSPIPRFAPVTRDAEEPPPPAAILALCPLPQPPSESDSLPAAHAA